MLNKHLNRHVKSGRSVDLFLAVIVITACCTAVQAQIVKSEIPYYAYGEGIGISAEDSLFLLNIHLRMQQRITYTSESESNLNLSELKAQVQQLRLRFDGFFYDPKIIYVVQLAFSKPDIASERSDVAAMVKDAVLFYRFNEHFIIGLGKTNLPRNRQAVMSAGDLQLIDRSLVNASLGLFRDFGFQAYFYESIGRFYYSLRGAITAGEGSNEYNSHEGLSYTTRIELLPLGNFENSGDYFEGDLEREGKPKLSIGLAYNFSHNTTRTGGSGSNFLYEPRDLTTLICDGIFKYQGLSASFEYVRSLSDGNPITVNEEGERSYVFVGHGQTYQAGYIFSNDFEIAGRYAAIIPGQELSSESDRQQEYTLGVSRYIKGHRFKIQSSLTYRINDSNLLEEEKENNWQFHLQLELGF